MKDMRVLGVGVVVPDTPDVVVENKTWNGSRVLTSDCYPSLVEAYAQASMWERAIEAYQEGFVVGREGVEAVNYRVSRGGCRCGLVEFVCALPEVGRSVILRPAFVHTFTLERNGVCDPSTLLLLLEKQ